MIEIECYQTVENRGLKETFEASPIHSKKGHQWLGQGYYFWTDSDYFAKQWGQRYDKYAILKYKIKVNKVDFLDLVGNVNDQLFFNRIKELYLKKLGFRKKVTLIEIVDFWRKEKILNHKVIKAYDIPHKHESIEFTKNRKEKFISPTRQQLLVTSGNEELISGKEWFFPKETDDEHTFRKNEKGS